MSYETSAADNRGGGSAGRNWAVVSAIAGPGGPPTGVLSVPATGSVGVPVTIGFSASDPQGLPVGWDLWASTKNESSGFCCYSGPSASVTFNTAGVYRVSVQAINHELSSSSPETAIISIGSATGIPPIAAATLDSESGPVPLTVNVNMSGSFDPDGSISYYFIGCGGYTVTSLQPTGSCTFSSPGTYWLLLQVQDNAGFVGVISKYVVVTPTGGATPPPTDTTDTTPPTVSITSPAPNATLTGTVNLQASASDNSGGSGVKEVEYYLDSTAGPSLGSATVSPYTVAWSTSPVSPGNHTIYAVARDNQGNVSVAASVAVKVNIVTPTVSLSPSSTVTVAKKGTLNMAATLTNTPTYTVSRVDFLVNGSVVCSDAAASYTCSWKAPAAPKTYQAQAKAYDSQGNVGSSNVLTISVK